MLQKKYNHDDHFSSNNGSVANFLSFPLNSN